MKNLPVEANCDIINEENELPSVDIASMSAHIDLKENATYIVSNGQLVKGEKPASGYGEQTITWQGGKPIHQKVSYTSKI